MNLLSNFIFQTKAYQRFLLLADLCIIRTPDIDEMCWVIEFYMYTVQCASYATLCLQQLLLATLNAVFSPELFTTFCNFTKANLK